jgi:antitoxin MazE
MEKGMRVAKWGNSLAVRIPADVVEALGLKEGDDIQLHVGEPGDFTVLRRPTQQELVARLRKYRGLISGDIGFDREEANAR